MVERKILVVDDEDMLGKIVARNLTLKTGCLVDIINSPDEALDAILNGNNYDLVVSDIDMSPFNGLELGKRVREAGNQIPFAYMTGLPSIERESIAKTLGLGLYEKPVEMNKLYADVKTYLDGLNNPSD